MAPTDGRRRRDLLRADGKRRRDLLRALGAAACAVGVAGCAGESPSGEPPTSTADSTPASTTAPRTPVRSSATSPARERPSTATERTPERTSRPGTTTVPAAWMADYETVEVRVRGPDGERRGAVTAAVADTPELKFRGLSDAPALAPDTGMVFPYDREADRTFVMRRMSFGIDIVYADASCAITRIHNAPEPGPDEDGNQQRYPGYGQYVLELPYRWTDEHGVGTGDVLEWDSKE